MTAVVSTPPRLQKEICLLVVLRDGVRPLSGVQVNGYDIEKL
jgi:hypothetical protein